MQEYEWLFVLLGLFGAILTSSSWIPQIFKTYRTKSLEDLSWATLLIFGTGTVCWLFYGIFKIDWLIIGANIFTGSCIGSLAIMKGLYKKNSFNSIK